MWVPWAGLPPRLTLSALTVPGRFCTLRFGAARRKDVPAGHRRALSDFQPKLVPRVGFGKSSRVYKHNSEPKRYITNPRVAENLVRILRRKRKSGQLFLECNPGPGFLTRALLESGARVIACESDKAFIPQLEDLGQKLGGKLKVVYCDFFKLDPRGHGALTPPIMTAETLFRNLGIGPNPWSKGASFKVVGVLPTRNERNTLWKLLHDLYSCTSIYEYGRVEVNLFVTEKECREPCSSFKTFIQNGQLEKKQHRESEQNLCFIQLSPHRNLFARTLTPFNYDVFFHMVRQCFMKRNAMLIDQLRSLSPIDALHIMNQMRKKHSMKIVDMYPEDFQRLFEIIECSKDGACRWLYDDFMEDTLT
ncbi:dimethyladenosine transferase 2, mitochondrial isoform X2 [Phacochoerus africanus]|uniref:dimethyladenosine transferase 2, mitochondrial isoform X2 n=1 Tax=Phacochoerus africanus TaxID=41426 RepID=UPI001FD9A5B2|nr:dimethyladenosine transferase 2, mitochondrial isoform X2 [Phacochoerus africanus]